MKRFTSRSVCRGIIGTALVLLLAVGGVPSLLGVTAAPAAKQEVSISLGVDAQILDPLDEGGNGGVEVNIQAHLFDTLVRRDDKMNVVPWVATEWRTVDPNTWEFKIRPGIKFHNGEDLDAAAVKANFDFIIGGQPGVSRIIRSWFAPVRRVDAPEKYTVRFVTSSPYPVLLAYMTTAPRLVPPQQYRQTGVVSGATGASIFGRRPVGSGPYRFVEWVSDDHLTLEAFPGYWGGAPAIRRVTYRPIPESGTRLAAFLTRKLDLISNITPDQIPQITSRDVGRIESAPSVEVIYISLRADKIPDRRVRQALFYATDIQSIVKNVLGGYGHEMKWGSAVTRQEFGYDPLITPYPYDPQAAKALLKRAEWVDTDNDGFVDRGGRRLKLSIVTTRGRYARSEEVTQAIAGQWAKVGVELDVRIREWGLWREQFLNRKFDEDIWLEGTGTRTFDADARLVNMIHSYVNEPGRSFGLVSYYANSDIDAKIIEARSQMDPKKRRELYRKILLQLRTDAYQMSLYQNVELYAVNKCLRPWVARPDTIIWLAKTSWSCP